MFYHPLFCKNAITNYNSYLPDTDLEEKIDATIKSEENQLAYLIGYAGMGKSTVLKHYFNYIGKEITYENNCLYYTKYTWDYYALIKNPNRINIICNERIY